MADAARAVVKVIDEGKANLKLLYGDDMPLFDKVRTIAKEIYRADDATADKSVKDQPGVEEMAGKLPVCIAKTQFCSRPTRRQGGAHRLSIPDARWRLSAGGFIVAICGDHDHAGSPKVPSADSIDVNGKSNRRAVLIRFGRRR